MHEKLVVQNFTVFSDLSVDFSPGINVFIGENGTGKTHLLKLLYALQTAQVQADARSESIAGKLVRVFRPDLDKLGRLVTRRQGRNKAKIVGTWGGKRTTLEFTSHATKAEARSSWTDVTNPVYIPVKEMMSIAPGFRSMYEKYDLKFEEVYYDILSLAYLPALRGKPGPDRQKLANVIRDVVSGTVVEVGEKFFLRTKSLGTEAKGSRNLEITLVAEGLRKLALIWKLIQNGALPEGRTLFWDEPEANLNPAMMPIVTEILLKLERMGVQIFAATHSYALLKELDLQRSGDSRIKFYSLYFNDDRLSVDFNAADCYDELQPNTIESEYLRLYEKQVDRALGSS
jgi:Recombinational DNA repair ATPase (RecF pathway)